jgi:hypothetical protein
MDFGCRASYIFIRIFGTNSHPDPAPLRKRPVGEKQPGSDEQSENQPWHGIRSYLGVE